MSKISGDRTFLPVNIALLTVSDSRTAADDKSGDVLEARITEAGHKLSARLIVKDEQALISEQLRRWIADPEISELVAELDRSSQPSPPIGQYSDATARALREHRFDRQALGARELAYERLDQLTIEILLGVR